MGHQFGNASFARTHVVNSDGSLFMETERIDVVNLNYDPKIDPDTLNYGYEELKSVRDEETQAYPWDKTYPTWVDSDRPKVFFMPHSKIRMPWRQYLLAEESKTLEHEVALERATEYRSALLLRAAAINKTLGHQLVWVKDDRGYSSSRVPKWILVYEMTPTELEQSLKLRMP